MERGETFASFSSPIDGFVNWTKCRAPAHQESLAFRITVDLWDWDLFGKHLKFAASFGGHRGMELGTARWMTHFVVLEARHDGVLSSGIRVPGGACCVR